MNRIGLDLGSLRQQKGKGYEKVKKNQVCRKRREREELFQNEISESAKTSLQRDDVGRKWAEGLLYVVRRESLLVALPSFEEDPFKILSVFLSIKQ